MREKTGKKHSRRSFGSILRMILASALGLFCLVCVSAINDPGRLGVSTRQAASSRVLAPAPRDIPAPIENLTDGVRVWAVRAPVDNAFLSPALAAACQFLSDAESLAYLEVAPARQPVALAPLLPQDGASAPRIFASAPAFADALDAFGNPLRWHLPANVLAAYSLPRPATGHAPLPKEKKAVIRQKFERALARLAPARSAASYRALVEDFARRYDLSPDLVMAIIHSESNFAPNIVSRKSAMGLMQLLPSTASDEVHRFLYGRRGQVSYAQLSQPETNIRYGTAYLHILNNRYFANVRDQRVREACVVAAYNLGPNRFLKLYGANNQAAVDHINSMTAEEFHRDLPKRLPVRETRFYVEKVKRMKQHYSGAQQPQP